MTSILENVLSEKVSVEDFKSWLLTDTLENSTDIADFIPYFLNFIKENCAWALTKTGKISESPSNKLLPSDDKKEFQLKNDGPLPNTSVSNKVILQTTRYGNDRNRGGDIHFQNHEQGYYEDGFKRRVKSNNVPYDETFRKRDERNFRKPDYGARKSLNFNFTTSGAVKSTSLNNDPTHVPDINSYDAFPPVGSQSNKNLNDSKIRRRITPTPVQIVQKGSSKFGNSRFVEPTEKVSNEAFERTPVVEAQSSDLRQEREMLKMTRDQFCHSQSSVLSNRVNNLRIESNVSPVKSVKVHYVTPDPAKISHKNKLEVFSIIYDLLISNALVPNVTSELYFIFELLTSKVSLEDKPENENNIFCSIHNCVFFAASVLCKLKKLLYMLDNITLSSLSEIPYLHKFSSNLIDFLNECCNERQEVTTKSQSINRVPFILEEDSSENFIDSHAFTGFRKQRDLFYELLRDWQKQSLDNFDSQFRDSFFRKAKHLINLGPNSINIYHLAKLFQNQLIASCLGLEVSEVYDELLSDIQKIFPDKIEKLRQRFMMPFCIGGPNPPPTFYGTQAFFSELIQAASSATLNQHLQDIFVSKILELNSSDIFTDGESGSISAVKEKYVFLLHTLRLLGKFLGYLHFLPYKVSEPLSLNVQSQQLISRNHSVAPLDLPKLLKLAIESNRLILTVPWVVEFLSMADPVGKYLPYVEESLEILASVYRGKYSISLESLSFGFLRFAIGWLFDVLCYPTKYCSLVQPMTFKENIEHRGIDFLPVIDKQLVHSCCPYLVEFKVLVYGFLNGIKNHNKREIRKITPLSTTKLVTSPSSGKQQEQMQLEENFFFIHPPSVKKTVEFVSERIASKIIQKIRAEVTDFKLQSVEYITNQEAYKTLLSDRETPLKRNAYLDSCILELYETSQSKISDYIHVSCPKDIRSVMPSLLSDDIKSPVLNMCCEIAIRVAVDKIIDWCDANLILKDIKLDIKNKIGHLLKDVDNAKEGNLNLSALLTKLRELSFKNFCGSSDLTCDYTPLLTGVLSVINKPIGYSTRKLLIFLSVDLYMSILTNCPKKCEECKKSFVSIWSLCPQSYGLEEYFLGVQNIKFLINGENLVYSCEKLAHMLTELINCKLFCDKKIHKCLESLKSHQWKDSKAKTVLCFLSNALKSYASSITKIETSKS